MQLLGYYLFMPIYGSAIKFHWKKYPKIKYAISDGGNWTFENIFFITEWIALKLKILTDINIRFTKKQTFSQSAQ
jgi:hypothetical protein